MSSVAQLEWSQYARMSFGSRPTASASKIEFRPRKMFEQESKVARYPELFALYAQLDQINALQANWDGHGSVRPDSAAIDKARQLLEDLYRKTAPAMLWQSPYVSASEDGEIVLEWWNGVRKLTIYVAADHSVYLKSWGANLVNEMEDGELPPDWITDPDWITGLWVWLSE